MIQAEQEDRKRKLELEASAASTAVGLNAPGSEDVVEVGKDGAFDVDQKPMVSRNSSAGLATCFGDKIEELIGIVAFLLLLCRKLSLKLVV